MANTVYMSKTGLTGGEVTKLDSIDGTGLVDNDVAFVNVTNVQYIYRLDADSGAAESSPNIIAPDTNAGDKRWILQAPAVSISPMFHAYLTASAENVTGDGTFYSMTGPIWTEVFDTIGSFSNGTFTAPAAGLYLFIFDLGITGISSSHTGMSIYPNNGGTYRSVCSLHPYNCSMSGDLQIPLSFTRYMALGETLCIQIVVSGGTKVIDIVGKGIGSIEQSTFTGFRII